MNKQTAATISLCIAIGIAVEAAAFRLGLYSFNPPSLVVAVVVVVFGGILSVVSVLTSSFNKVVQFAAGAIVGIVIETLNENALRLWTFGELVTSALPNAYVRTMSLGTLAGLVPVVVNSAVRYIRT